MLLSIHAVFEQLGLHWDLRLGERQLVARLEAVSLGLLELFVTLGRALRLLLLLIMTLVSTGLGMLTGSRASDLSGTDEII